jgi:hypothetical protein
LVLVAGSVLPFATLAEAPIFRSERDKGAATVCKAAKYQAAGKSEDAWGIINGYNRSGKQPVSLVGAAVRAAELRRSYAPTQIMRMILGLNSSQPDVAYWLVTCMCLEDQSVWDNDCT